MLVALMVAVGLYYEEQAGNSQAALEGGADEILVAATAVRKPPQPELASINDCESPDLKSLHQSEIDSELQQTDDNCNNGIEGKPKNP